jgi:hypothetical protein
VDNYVIKKLPKANNHPIGEISPNLVTLITRASKIPKLGILKNLATLVMPEVG